MAVRVNKEGPDGGVLDVVEISIGTLDCCIVGKTPLLLHAVGFKAKGQLLFPSPKKTQTEKATTMKHEPYEEYRAAAYKFRDVDDRPTRLYMPGAAFHSAVSAVAIDMVGAKKAQVARLTNIPVEKLPVWGIPQMWSGIVRSSDMARTPDVRILPILPRWATRLSIEFVDSLVKYQSLANLLGAAGTIVGVGDGRPQKGKLTFGKFRICQPDDPEFLEIVRTGGREVQDKNLADPLFYDIDTEELITWFMAEKGRRVASPARAPAKKNGATPLEVPSPEVLEAQAKSSRKAKRRGAQA